MTISVDAAYASVRHLLSTYLTLPIEQRLAYVSALRPNRDELNKIFQPAHAVDSAENGYRQLWGNAPVWPVPQQPELEVFCASSDELAHGRDRFPSGYQDISEWLHKGVMWAAWLVRSEGRADGVFFDGLVMIDGERWRWCPRPWKVLPTHSLESLKLWPD